MADCTINVMMFGGRRCGKTSVITAMNRNFEDVFGLTSDLVIAADDFDTMVAIEEKEQDIDSFFQKRPFGEFNTDGRPTADGTEYLFELQIKGKSSKRDRITLSLYDFPGEWLTSNSKEKNELLKERMSSCGIIMIAIDTPYLMEPFSDVQKSEHTVGTWNDRRNYCKRITQMIKTNFAPNEGPDPKMILFVPLKCEKYYANGVMGLVNLKIQEAYKDLLNFTNAGENRGCYELVIAPILTFGKDTVVFTRFKTDEDGEPIMDERGRCPTVPLFKFENRSNTYSPQFCEQPLLYALSYLLSQMYKVKKSEREKSNIFGRLWQSLGETFGNWASVEDFLLQFEKIKTKLKLSGDGYQILSDPLDLKNKTVETFYSLQ